ncbi:MAG: hypothetical protein LUO95_01070 [Methylococcaceae bacterium]|nr:hypothetical protein [Methylococcaceae bacterium]MDD1615320.1 hypothetical protein [Methylococcaceae bacterium]OYV20607.1 MAG: hypothetical protein CG439_388 [Methylococcaceae bacterium NSP1-2]
MKTKQTIAAIALTTLSLSAHANLAQVGPVNSANGFPFWYQDLNGTTLDLCLPNASDPGALQQNACLLVGAGIPNPPYVFPSNYPDEIFYMRTVSTPLDVGGRRGILVLALEAAFGTGAPAVGQQTVFTRIRLTTGVPEQGDYTLTHPYGTNFFPDVASQGANRDIFFTEDVGIAPGMFTDALTSRVGPFLKPVVADAAGNPAKDAAGNVILKAPVTLNGAQFISDGAAAELVTGSPFGTNYFMLCGKRPDGTDIKLGDALANGSGYDAVNGKCARTDTFALTGRLHDNVASPIATPITINSATFSRNAANGTHLDAYVTASKPLATSPTPVVTIAGLNVAPVKMFGPNALKQYYVQGLTVPSNDKPAQLTAINSADNPPSSVTGNVVDDVIINSANYVSNPSTGVGTLTVVATSSDKGLGTTAAPAPTLALVGYPTATHTFTGGTTDPSLATIVATLLPTDLPPDTVTVLSSDGGQETIQVVKGRDVDYSAAGVPFVQNDTVTTVASAPAFTIPVTGNDVANVAAPITGINIIAPLPSSGTAVVSGSNIVYTPGTVVTDASHPAPEIRYTANSSAGLSNVGTVTVTVTAPAGGAAPIANADGPINVLAGSSKVIDVLANDSGNGSALVPSSVVVTNVTGASTTPTVDPATGKVTFTAGTTLGSTFGFDYTVANASGLRSPVARVSVPVNNETITISRAQCKSNSWRIAGTTSIAANNLMTFYRTNTVQTSPTTAQTIGSIAVDAAGAFDFRGTGSCTTSPTANRMSMKSAIGTIRNNQTVTN